MTNTARRDHKSIRWFLAAVLLLLTVPAVAPAQPLGTPVQVETQASAELGSVRARCFHAALQSPHNLPGACWAGLVPVPSAWAILGLLLVGAVGIYAVIDPEVAEVYIGAPRLWAITTVLAVATVSALIIG